MGALFRYVCKQCGIVVKAEENQDHRACACNAGWTVIDDATDEVVTPPDPPADPPPE